MGAGSKKRKAKAKAKWRAKNKDRRDAKHKDKWNAKDRAKANVDKSKAKTDRVKAKADAKARTKANRMAKAKRKRCKKKKYDILPIREVRLCPKCLKKEQNSSHHIYPKRHFGNGGINKDTIRLCRDCHNDLEILIPSEEQSREVYTDILGLFLQNDVRWLICSIGGSGFS